MERSAETSLSRYEQEEVCKILGCCNPRKFDNDSMGFVAVLQHNLHSPTGSIAIASHQSLKHRISEEKAKERISEEKAKETDRIAKSNTHLFFAFYFITKLHSGDIPSKIHWLEMVRLAQA